MLQYKNPKTYNIWDYFKCLQNNQFPYPKSRPIIDSHNRKLWDKLMIVGYARVSTSNQNTMNQHYRLEEYGCEKIYTEKASGALKKRIELEKVIDFVREGDSLVCTRLDRLARSLSDLVNITEQLSNKNVQLVILDQELDTTTTSGKLLFHIIGAIAEFERSLTLERTEEGRIAAKTRGVKFGRKTILTPEKLQLLREEFPQETDKKSLARRYGISRSTLYRLCSGE